MRPVRLVSVLVTTRRFVRDAHGAVAVEFALLGSTFLLLVCMTLELGLILLTQTTLDNAAREGARLIRLGQAATSSAFIAKVCESVGVLVPSCAGTLTYRVQSAPTFATLAAGGVLDNAYSPGGSGQSVVAQVGYSRATLVPWASSYLNGSTLIVSTVVFQNDPY